MGAWTFYGEEQGLSPEVFDVSADDKPTEFETPGVQLEVVRLDQARSLRDVLVREIAAAEVRALAAQ